MASRFSRSKALGYAVFSILFYFLMVQSATALCDSEGVNGECIVNEDQDISGERIDLNSIFSPTESSTIHASSMADINIFNTSLISGLWKGSFNISSKNPRITSGASFKPEGGLIVIGSELPDEKQIYPQSCEDVEGSSGMYQIDPLNNDKIVEVYCDMETDGGGWTLVANVEDQSIAPSDAPTIPANYTDYPTTGGGYPTVTSGGSGGGISYLRFNTYGIEYSEVRGEITIDSSGSLDAISDCCTSGTHLGIDDYYVDGVSATTYQDGSRTHLHTFINDGGHNSGQEYSCPGQGGDPVSVVNFDVDSWECRDGGTGVNYNPFSVDLNSETTAKLEIRPMKDEPDSNENVVLRDTALWIR